MSNLRPYYDHDTFNPGYSVIFKPDVGLVDPSTNRPITANLTSSNFAPGKGIGISNSLPSLDINGNKNYVYDLELQEYFDYSNFTELFKNLVWSFFKNYCKVLVSQPFEIVRLVLQVGVFDFGHKTPAKEPYTRLLDESDSEEPEINYFQLANEWAEQTPLAQSEHIASDQTTTSAETDQIRPISKHTVDILTAIASQEGPVALFRGINAQFIHQTLSHTIEAWITGFVSPFLGIPDPFFLELTRLTDPLRSLWLSVLACVLTGLILMPFDLIKVRLMLTKFNKPDESTEKVNTRSIRESIRHYPPALLLNPPPTVALLTTLHQFATTVFRKTAPYFIFVRFNVDSYLSPNWYTVLNLVLLITELFIKLPVENLLRKEQVRYLLQPKEEDPMKVVTIEDPDQQLIVKFNNWAAESSVGGFGGFVNRIKRLQLFDGWRVGVLNIIGFWGYNIFKSTGTLQQEKL